MSKYQGLNQRTYDGIASKYEEIYGQIPTSITLAKKLVEILKDRKELKVLDLGCGPGSILKIFEDGFLDADLIGVDYSKELLKIAESKLKRTKLIQSDLLSYEPNSKFDVIIASFSLIHLTNDELTEMMERMHSLISKDGYVFISFIIGEGEKVSDEVLDPSFQIYFNYHSVDEIKKYFPKERFELIEEIIDKVEDEFEVEEDIYLIYKALN